MIYPIETVFPLWEDDPFETDELFRNRPEPEPLTDDDLSAMYEDLEAGRHELEDAILSRLIRPL